MGTPASDWRIHGMSVEGYRHRRDGLPCQDACAHTESGPLTVLAVADGAGSRPRSEEGSRLAVALAAEHFVRRAAAAADDPPGESVHELLLDAFHDVTKVFLDTTGPGAADFATTLTVVVLAPGWLGHLSVGDGFVVLRAGSEDGERQFHLLPQPPAVSEYSNETVFLTSPDAAHQVHTDCVSDEGVDGVLLSTDGLAQAALSRSAGGPPTPNASFVDAVFRSLDAPGPLTDSAQENLAALLRSDRLTALNADDKTLLRAVRRARS
ncbi:MULTISPECIES: PP2C family serine/threonine-protein phosphatase [unclassified Streptomyces]|uniref:PP2C family serine/threonine-protein phosphatase n=1 Tax=unclassified Streptomyces TaxID=2593676 RepID=UPI002256CF62|nr:MULTISPECIES: PP2C family serine/threonine-protein phosphatase [unclassified Streptomyces]MCX5061082.1 protein phosphatase 2C domain-containing protein [Streptomyces sp. NBC_00452]MCX5293293.1 protein phosphatase 2C domain-containing protein [Streptomyces sp. NBC_00183]